jgi:RHS repeat-associated protein
LSSYNGQRYDEAAGLYYFGARHYDAELGRFLTADTQVQDPLNPKCLNRYAFGAGNPVRNVDPSGHAWWDWVIGIFVVIAIVVVGVLTAGAAFAAFGLAAAVIAGFTFLGAATFAVIALAQGTSPLSSDFWIAIAAGAVVGAAVGAMLTALPASLGFTGSLTGAAGFFAGLAADVLVGAVLGGLGTVVNHIAKGGGPEDVLKEKLGWEILTSVAKGAIFGLVTGVVLNKLALFSPVAFGLAAILSAGLAIEGIWEVSKAGYEPNDKFSFLNIFGSDANWFKNSPLRGLGIPSWAFSGTWLNSGRSEGGYLLQTLPLVP